jgi:hypothetical protein
MNVKALAVTAALMCVMLAPIAVAADSVVGEWEFKSQMPARTSEATMTIKKSAEGKYEGTWSTQWGESTISDITFDNGTVKFVVTSNFGGQEMKMTHEGKVEGTKLTGKGKGQWGEFTFDGNLQGEAKTGADAIVGQWQINVTVPAREMVDKLTITKNADGNLAGKWVSQRGENTISDMKFEAGKLTFARTSKMGEMEFTSTFEGTVEGDTIKGVFKSERGDREVTATRVGAKPAAAKEEAKKSEPNKPK